MGKESLSHILPETDCSSPSSTLHVTSRNLGAMQKYCPYGDLRPFPHVVGATDEKHIVIEAAVQSLCIKIIKEHLVSFIGIHSMQG